MNVCSATYQDNEGRRDQPSQDSSPLAISSESVVDSTQHDPIRAGISFFDEPEEIGNDLATGSEFGSPSGDLGEPYRPESHAVEVFSLEAVDRAMLGLRRRDREVQERCKETATALRKNDGWRYIPSLEPEICEAICVTLLNRFPNFSEAVRHIRNELTLAMASAPQSFCFTPLLVYGQPGIGKTAFSNALASLLNVGFEKVPAGSMQGAFELVGTSAHWSNTGPGRILNCLADGEFATPVLMLDEIDKLSYDDRYPIMPALLELLEPESSRSFTDQSLMLSFDASKMIVIATANDIAAIPGPLLSRLNPIEINPPNLEERRSIAESIFKGFAKYLILPIGIDDDALDILAKSPMDVRVMSRLLRSSVGRAIQDGKTHIDANPFKSIQCTGGAHIGFI